MWRRLPKYKPMPELAPPTSFAGKDGSRYFPPIMNNVGKPQPSVPQGPRTKSATRFIEGLEQRRQAALSDKVKTNPLCYVSAVIERLPVVQVPLKTWETDFALVQAIAWEETEKLLPPLNLKQNRVENSPWAVDTFKDVFGKNADKMLALHSPPVEDATKATQVVQAAAEVPGKKQQKQQKKKEPAGKAAATSGEATPAAPAGGKSDKPPANAPPSWQKAMADLGIDLAEDTATDEDDSPMKMFVELKTKKDDKSHDFVAASRITEADKTNDRRSLDRKLWHKLYLVVKRQGKWGFPRVIRKQNEGLLSAAYRATCSVFDGEARVDDLYFVSSCPIGYRPADTANEFMLKVQLIDGGNLDLKSCAEPVEDFAWLTPPEVAELLVGPDTTKDEYTYLIRMFADDWWEDLTDSPEMSPKDDELTRKPLKEVAMAERNKRIKEEMTKWDTRRRTILGGVSNVTSADSKVASS